MKKIFILLAALSFVAACNKEDKGGNTPGSNNPVSKLEVVFDLKYLSDDVKNYFDLAYEYVDFKGEKKTTTITDNTNIVFDIENPNLVNENSAPLTFSFNVIAKVKTGVAQKAEGETYDCNHFVMVSLKGQYSDKTVENFSHNCFYNESGWDEAFNYELFTTTAGHISTEGNRTFKVYLVKNQDETLRLKAEQVK